MLWRARSQREEFFARKKKISGKCCSSWPLLRVNTNHELKGRQILFPKKERQCQSWRLGSGSGASEKGSQKEGVFFAQAAAAATMAPDEGVKADAAPLQAAIEGGEGGASGVSPRATAKEEEAAGPALQRAKEHLVVLVHGLFGSDKHLKNVVKAMESNFDEATAVAVYVSNTNKRTKTLDGIEACGERLIAELNDFLAKDTQKRFKTISFVGHRSAPPSLPPSLSARNFRSRRKWLTFFGLCCLRAFQLGGLDCALRHWPRV